MTVYSHSRLSCFEQCSHKYKLQYIDRVETEVEESIEAFLGSRVHETLEKLYQDLKFQKENTIDDLISYLNDIWNKNWDDSIVIVKEEYGPDNYLKMAEKFVTDYHNRYHPFNQGKTIALEDRFLINLDEEVNPEDLGILEPNILPDSPFYFLKEWGRNIQSFFTINSVAKAYLKEKFANEKLIEFKLMVEQNKNRERIEEALRNYKQEVDEAERITERMNYL